MCLVLGGMSGPGEGGVCWSGTPPPHPVNRMTDRCKNITLATTSLRPVIRENFSQKLMKKERDNTDYRDSFNYKRNIQT